MKRNMRKGMGTMDLALALVIFVVVIGGSILAYKKLYIPSMGDSAFKQISSVVSAIERTKMSNDYAFPTANVANLNAVPLVLDELGGVNNSRDVANWTYDCSAGSGQTVTLTTTAFSDPTIANIAANKANTTLRPWTAIVAGSVVSVTLANATCN